MEIFLSVSTPVFQRLRDSEERFGASTVSFSCFLGVFSVEHRIKTPILYSTC